MLPDRIELSTSPLPRECSTTELVQQAPCAFGPPTDLRCAMQPRSVMGGPTLPGGVLFPPVWRQTGIAAISRSPYNAAPLVLER